VEPVTTPLTSEEIAELRRLEREAASAPWSLAARLTPAEFALVIAARNALPRLLDLAESRSSPAREPEGLRERVEALCVAVERMAFVRGWSEVADSWELSQSLPPDAATLCLTVRDARRALAGETRADPLRRMADRFSDPSLRAAAHAGLDAGETREAPDTRGPGWGDFVRWAQEGPLRKGAEYVPVPLDAPSPSSPPPTGGAPETCACGDSCAPGGHSFAGGPCVNQILRAPAPALSETPGTAPRCKTCGDTGWVKTYDTIEPGIFAPSGEPCPDCEGPAAAGRWRCTLCDREPDVNVDPACVGSHGAHHVWEPAPAAPSGAGDAGHGSNEEG
jgi:hypothetical protein